MSQVTTSVHVFIEIERNKQVKLEFENPNVTGREIKEKAVIPLDDDLALRRGQKLELITNDQLVTLKNGDHFVALPPGTIS